MVKNIARSHSHNVQDCFFCRNFHEFELPSHLLQEMLEGRVVLFAGAGISTEGKQVLPSTLYDDVLNEIDSPNTTPFSELMTRFCERPNGRAELLRKIRKR